MRVSCVIIQFEISQHLKTSSDCSLTHRTESLFCIQYEYAKVLTSQRSRKMNAD